MKNPYIVGRWVRGSDHYDRQGLTEYLLTAQDTAIWVMGARRMGKTSLLRHLEHVTRHTAPTLPKSAATTTANVAANVTAYVALYWDLQGCTSQDDLSQELYHAIEDAQERFADAGIDTTALAGLDAISLLRQLNRALAQHNRQLLLLVDEAEVLVTIAQHEPAWLARLRKVFQEGRQRTIIASTKMLATMTDRAVDWITSPFLFGFHLVNLNALERVGAQELICQAQTCRGVQVHPAIMEQILAYTNGHPYLLQWLCQRLFVPLSEDQGYLRDVQEGDLLVDPLMAGLFQVDFSRLTFLERRILLSVARAGRCTPEALNAWLPAFTQAATTAATRSLEDFGHLRRADNLLEIGNEFLYRWLLAQTDILLAELTAEEPNEPGDATDDIAQLARLLGIDPARIRDLLNIKISSNEEFFQAIQGFFIQIRHLVEQDDGHRLLLTSGENGESRLRSEDDVQIALKHWLRPMCRALNIHMDREPLTGRGLLDFKFSLGHDFRCLVEVKLFNNTRLQDGVAIQLPIYLLADHAVHGLYVPIFLDSAGYPATLERLCEAAAQQAERHGVQVKVVDIRAWKPISASRADSVGEFDRYRLPHMLGEEDI
ncbi:MAG: AAA family ATPase [Litorilinea sp.]